MKSESESGLGKHGLLHMLMGFAYSRRWNQRSHLFSYFFEKHNGAPQALQKQ